MIIRDAYNEEGTHVGIPSHRSADMPEVHWILVIIDDVVRMCRTLIRLQ